VNSSMNYIVYRGYQNDAVTIARAQARLRKHQGENVNQYRMNS
jgi:hypothetical protein